LHIEKFTEKNVRVEFLRQEGENEAETLTKLKYNLKIDSTKTTYVVTLWITWLKLAQLSHKESLTMIQQFLQ
jgi:hypothetical protein